MVVLTWPEATWLPSSGWDGAHVSLVWSYVPTSGRRIYLNHYLHPASTSFRAASPHKTRVKKFVLPSIPPSSLPLPSPARVAVRGEVARQKGGTVRQRWVCTHTPPLPARSLPPELTRRALQPARPLVAPHRCATPPLYLVTR